MAALGTIDGIEDWLVQKIITERRSYEYVKHRASRALSYFKGAKLKKRPEIL